MKIATAYILITLIAVLIIAVATISLVKIKTKLEPNKITLPSIEEVPNEFWTKLARKKIFFGHKSVGYDILEGIKDIIKERNYIQLNIVQTNNPAEFDQPIFAHSQVGKNTDPVSKINSFKDIMDSGVGNKVDIASFKFCYVDIMRDSDPQKIFDGYSAAIEELKARYSDVQFVHFTVPVCSAPKGIKKNLKQSIKRLIGKPGILEDNQKRQKYNTILAQAYSTTEPIFDLALIESITPDGFRCYANKGTEKVFLMASQNTTNGGHLNERGRKKAAEQLLILLANIVNKQ